MVESGIHIAKSNQELVIKSRTLQKTKIAYFLHLVIYFDI